MLHTVLQSRSSMWIFCFSKTTWFPNWSLASVQESCFNWKFGACGILSNVHYVCCGASFPRLFKKKVPWKWLESLVACLVWAKKKRFNESWNLWKISHDLRNAFFFPSDLCYGFPSTFQPRSLCHSWHSLQFGTLPNFLSIGTPFLGENRCHSVIIYPVNKGGKIGLLMHWKYKETEFHNIFILMLIWNEGYL